MSTALASAVTVVALVGLFAGIIAAGLIVTALIDLYTLVRRRYKPPQRL